MDTALVIRMFKVYAAEEQGYNMEERTFGDTGLNPHLWIGILREVVGRRGL